MGKAERKARREAKRKARKEKRAERKTRRKGVVETKGKIFLRPSEESAGAGLSKKTGATISIPKTRRTYSPSKKNTLFKEEFKKELFTEPIEPTPSEIAPAKSITSMKLGLGTAVGMSGRNIFKAVKGERKWKGSLSPIKHVGEQHGEKVAFQERQSNYQGTIRTDIPMVQQVTYRDLMEREKFVADPSVKKYTGMRKEDVASAIGEDVSYSVSKEYQKKIDVGTMNLEDAQTQAEIEVQKRFKEQASLMQKYYKKTSGLGNLGERKGAIVLRKAPVVLETAGLVGLGLTGAGGLAVAGGIIATKGTLRASRTLANEDLTTGQKVKGLSLSALEVGLGVAGMGSGFRAVERSIVADEFKLLSGKKWKFTEVRQTGGKVEPFELLARRQSGMLKQELSLEGELITKGKKYFVPKTSATVTTEGELSWNILNARKGTKIIDIKTFDVSGTGYSIPTGTKSSFSMGQTLTKPVFEMGTIYKGGTPTMEIAGKLGKSFKVSQGAMEMDVVAGTSKQIKPNIYSSKGFKIDKFEIDTFKKTFNIDSKQTARGFTFLVPKKTIGLGDKPIVIQSGKKGLGSQQFTQTLQTQGFTSAFSKVTPTITQTKGFVAPVILSPKVDTKVTTFTQTVSPKLDVQLKTAQIPSPRVSEIIKIEQETKTKTSVSTSQPSTQLISPFAKTTPQITPALKSTTKQITKQQSRLTFGTPTFQRGFDLGFSPRFNPKIPFAIPFLKRGAFRFGGTEKVGGIRKFSYAPSFKAMMFNIKTSRATPSPTKKWTGLETRPITKGFTFFKIKEKKRTNNLNEFSLRR